MSRRRGEFEHRTSIFEGSFRAWSYLGGLDPIELETKSLTELDPLSTLAEERSRFDGRLSNPEYKEQIEERDIGRRFYPYEPLPRSGLAHPFVQAILSPWLGPEADSNAIHLGLTTLRTWWQHRRKGESGSAIAALGTEKMQGVVDNYTRHFFSLAYYLVKNGKEAPPRTLFTKMKELEKQRPKQSKRRLREGETENMTAVTPQAGRQLTSGISLHSNSPTSLGSESTASELIEAYRRATEQTQALLDASSVPGAAPLNGTAQLSALEQFALIQSQLYPESRPSMGQYTSESVNLSLQNLALQQQIQETKSLLLGELYMAKLNKETSIYPRSASLPMSSTFPEKNYSVPRSGSETLNHTSSAPFLQCGEGEAEIDNKVPIVVIYPSGDAHIAMKVDGVNSLHCVKIVETVLKGCSGKKAPIDGLLDAAADHELSSVLIKIDKSSNARRIAKESSRNMAMVGYTAKVIEIGADLASCHTADPGMFEVLANAEVTDLFDWRYVCSCAENGFSRKDCMRHRQMNPRIFNAFWNPQACMAQYLSVSDYAFGRISSNLLAGFQPVSVSPSPFNIQNTSVASKVDFLSGQNIADPASELISSTSSNPREFVTSQALSQNKTGANRRPSDSWSFPVVPLSSGTSRCANSEGIDNIFENSEQVSKQLTATAFASSKVTHRDSITSATFGRRRFSHQSETTFGRALSGLSALSIDWENMDDFDIDVDHSAHVNNDISGSPAKYTKPVEDDLAEEINLGAAAFKVEEGDVNNVPVGRRSSLRGFRRVGGNDWSLTVSFKEH